MKAKTENIILGLGALALVGFLVKRTIDKGKEFADKLNFRIKSVKIPSFTGSNAMVPVVIELKNPVDVGVTASNIVLDVSVKQADGSFKNVGHLSHPNTESVLPLSTKELTITPEINLANINPFKGTNLKDFFSDLFTTKTLLVFKIDWSAIIEGVDQNGSEIKEVAIPKLLAY